MNILVGCTVSFLFFFDLFAHIKINEFNPFSVPQQIELFNESSESASLGGWYLDDSGGSSYYIIPNESLIASNSCKVFSYDFNLNTASSDTVRLFSPGDPPTTSSALLIDSYKYTPYTNSQETYQRNPDGSGEWIMLPESLQKNNQNKQLCISILPSLSPTLPLIPTNTPTPSPTTYPTEPPYDTYDDIFLTEIMVYPESNVNEWIEFYNNSDAIKKLYLYIDDCIDVGSSFRSVDVTLSPKSYKIFTLTSSIYNNDKDCIRILDRNFTVLEDFEYSNPLKGKSLGKYTLTDNVLCNMETTPLNHNSPCLDVEVNTNSSLILKSPSITPHPSSNISIIAQPVPNVGKTTQPANGTQSELSGDILGESSIVYINSQNSSPSNKNKKIHILTITSISYSLLTVSSILYKMRRCPQL